MLGNGYHLEDLYHARDDIVQIQILQYHREATRLTLRPFQKIIEQIMHFFRFFISLIKQFEKFWAYSFWRCRSHNQIKHHTNAGHRRAQIVGNNGIHLIAITQRSAELLILLLDNALGGYQ